jgi:TonB family protein
MSSREDQYSAWPVRRWIAGILLILAAQFALLFWISEHKVWGSRPAVERTLVQVVPLDELDATTRELFDLQDPTIRALVSHRGFSGRAWMTMPRFNYQLPIRPSPPRWLEPPLEEWTGDFDEFVQTNLVFETFLSEKLQPLFAHVRLPIPLVSNSTVLRIEWDLASRGLLDGQALPAAPEPILSNSIVRVLVRPQGTTLSATLLSSSGSAAADQEALRFSRSARFKPVDDPDSAPETPLRLDPGVLIFQWSSVQWSAAGSARMTE